MKPTIKKVQPVKVVAPFLNSQSESPVPLDALTDQEKVSDLYFLKGTVHQIAKPYLSINNCTFKQQINLSMVKMRTARFSHCNFRNGSLNDSKLMPAAFDTCELLEADFSHTSLKGIDLRNSRIAGIQLNIADLKGAIVSSLQAIDLLPLLGVKIEDD